MKNQTKLLWKNCRFFSLSLLVVTFFLFIHSSVVQANVAVVTSLECPDSELTFEQVKNLFMGKIRTLPSGVAVKLLDQSEDRAIRAYFYEKLAEKTLNDMKVYWSQLTFTGKATAPEVVRTNTAVKQWLASHPNGIGYIDEPAVDQTVKVLLRVK